MLMNSIKEIKTDVLVVGGGPAGVGAALAAARAGADVILCQNRSVLGGNASSEIRMHIVGADANGFRSGYPLETEARETGIVEELRLRQACENPTRSPHGIDMVLYDMVRSEPRIQLLLDTYVTGAETKDGRIVAARAERPAHEEIFNISATHYIDASGDSALAVSAGNPVRRGREGKREYGETHALDLPDASCLGSTVLFQAKRMDHAVPFQAPAWARKFSEADLARRPHSLGQAAGGEPCGYEYGFWWIEWGGELDTIQDNDRIRHELLAIAYGIWDHLKNGGEHDAGNWVLTWVGMLPGKRESRRLLGRQVLTEKEVIAALDCPDAIAFGGWPIDLHPPMGVDSPEEAPCTQIEVPYLYPIPLSCCGSAVLENLWFAGRNISATHVAFASTRVMATCFAVGQGVGVAAARAVADGLSVTQLIGDPERMHGVQQELLRQDAFLIGVRNEDSKDFARHAAITASDWQTGGEPALVIDGYTRSTHGPRGTRPGAMPEGIHRWMSQKLPATLHLSWDTAVQVSAIQLTFDTGLHRWLSLTQSDLVHARTIWGPQPETLRDYHIYGISGNSEALIVEVQGNYLRQRIHTFESREISGLRIEALASNGIDYARIVEVRVY